MRLEADNSPLPVDRGREREQESQDISGMTTRLVLSFVEREGGRAAVDALLEDCRLSDREGELRNEHMWFPDEIRIRMFESAERVLGDPRVGRRMGAAAVEFNTGQALKLSLRALGSARLVYSNVGRASAKFNRVHKMDLVELGSNNARIRNVPLEGGIYHPCNCEFNIGLLSCVPLVFSAQRARVRHTHCIANGAAECIYEVEWASKARTWAPAVAAALALAAMVTGVLAPALLWPALAAAVALIGYSAVHVVRERHHQWQLLRRQLAEQGEVTERLMASMQDLVSGLQLDEVLSKVTANAGAAIGGVEFALLVEDSGHLRSRSVSRLPAAAISALEEWADGNGEALSVPLIIDELSQEQGLGSLSDQPSMPLGSLCSTPLDYQGRNLGMLIALGGGSRSFLPRDLDVLGSYAAQAAIALTNAARFETQQELATHDPLTGLYNHRHFHAMLGREVERCQRNGGSFGLLVFDLDDFKKVNDTGGHAEGDEVLRRVARALESTCRSSDEAFRVGGDEFALILPDADRDRTEVAASRASEVISAIDERTSISCGISSWPEAGESKDAILARADASLYEMKRRAVRDHALPRSVSAEDQNERLASASRLAVRLAPLLDETEIAETAVEELQRAFHYHRVIVHKLGPGLELSVVAGAGPVRAIELTEGDLLDSDELLARAIRAGEAVLENDAAIGAGGSERLGQGPGSELAAPIRIDGQAWGVLELARLQRHGFDYDDLLFADTIAAGLGAAIQRGQLYSDLEGAFMRTLAVLCDALEAKDDYTAAHARDVSELAVSVGRTIGMSSEELRMLGYGALLHDIGKIAIRSEILHKPGPLTTDEYEEMKQHTVVGARMLERIPYFEQVRPLVRNSHERWDGGGYPDGLEGDSIPIAARIISACDAFHAMTSDRPYRRAMPVEDAVAELRRHSGTQFDRAVVDVLVEGLAKAAVASGSDPGPADSPR